MERLRGEFLVGGRQIPNQFTLEGCELMLRSAFWRSGPTWNVGLCASLPADKLTLADVVEPTIGLNGYERQALPMSQSNWPAIEQTVGEVYVESRNFTFDITGALDQAVNRLFITEGSVVIAVSTPFVDQVQILDAPLTTRYRFYFR